ncbi:DUF6096 family protein [Lactococcus petauri]|jgi:hypothetical protein|uniref:DUF6096 family protein n=2 Tax=Lactococcus TaxID=1357 RepID=A0AAJ2IUD2_9LACT|nr:MULTISPECIES: DUF6096 family protein [Lactococcus]MDG6128714.1 DUF6096 family protein [Lactococcus formosensis]MDT2583567.1 DUF6096 family protein [Lactococcus petauri]QSQ99529.1 hypothetical protein J0J34_05420 [Lactococcus garvieae]GFO52885.1 hypothetical protein ikelab_21600 [Lactococcus garvieae]
MTKGNIVKMPNTKQFEFGGLNLQLRLDGKAILAIEKRLDESLMGLFLNGQGGMKLPASNKLLIVLQGANQTSRVTDQDLVRAFEKYLDSGKTTLDMFSTIQELLDESGFFGKETEKEATNGESLDKEVEGEELL